MIDIDNPVAVQLRQNAKVILGPAYRTGQIPEAAIAGALQMGAEEIDRLQKQLLEVLAGSVHPVQTPLG
jgi:hypothetical protein